MKSTRLRIAIPMSDRAEVEYFERLQYDLIRLPISMFQIHQSSICVLFLLKYSICV